jgi:hypothetical protein
LPALSAAAVSPAVSPLPLCLTPGLKCARRWQEIEKGGEQNFCAWKMERQQQHRSERRACIIAAWVLLTFFFLPSSEAIGFFFFFFLWTSLYVSPCIGLSLVCFGCVTPHRELYCSFANDDERGMSVIARPSKHMKPRDYSFLPSMHPPVHIFTKSSSSAKKENVSSLFIVYRSFEQISSARTRPATAEQLEIAGTRC